MSFGTLSDDATLLPETINTAMPTFTLDRTTLRGSAHTTSGNLIFTSHPTRTLDVDVRYRYYQYDGRTPEATQLVGPRRVRLHDRVSAPLVVAARDGPLDLDDAHARRRRHTGRSPRLARIRVHA